MTNRKTALTGVQVWEVIQWRATSYLILLSFDWGDDLQEIYLSKN